MTITIRIDTANAAFDDSNIEEVSRIIKDWLDSNMRFTSLYDINGNKVGTVKVTAPGKDKRS